MKHILFFVCLITLALPHVCSAQEGAIAGLDRSYSPEVQQPTGNNRLLWLCPACTGKREALQAIIKAADSLGLTAADYQLPDITVGKQDAGVTTGATLNADAAITKAALAFCADLWQGVHMQQWVSYNGLATQHNDTLAGYLLKSMTGISDSAAMTAFIHSLEPQTPTYKLLKAELACQLRNDNSLAVKQLASTLNYYRWIQHYKLDSFIVINIGAATLTYYKHDTVEFRMRTVVGAPDTRTPRFAAYCTAITLYPYWNMPRSIAVNDWLQVFKKKPSMLGFFNMEVLDAKGKKVPAASINWKQMNSRNFPYRIREGTGCNNPLGVVKFTLSSPYDVYMHDTNFKGAFLAKSRYYSHGCIRLQDPVQLANALLPQAVDTAYLNACYKDQAPKVLPLTWPVPVFVVYMCAEAGDDGTISYYKDMYGLLK